MSYKTTLRRNQRKKSIKVSKKRRLWLEQLRDEAFEDWKKKYYEGPIYPATQEH
jgi:hypothetical protein